MIRFIHYSVPVPVLAPNPEPFFHAYVDWFSFWIKVLEPPKHEVIPFPITLKHLPARPVVDPEQLPENVVQFEA